MSARRGIPASIDIEGDVLGTTLYDPDLLSALHHKPEPDDFYWESHQNIWRVILDLAQAGRRPVEAVVRDEIIARGWQDRTQGRDANGNMLGDCGYLSHLTSICYPQAYGDSVGKLLELSRCRRGIAVCARITDDLQSGGIKAAESLTEGIRQLGAILNSSAAHQDAVSLAQLAQDEGKRLLESSGAQNSNAGVPTGFDWIDKAMRGGFQEDDLVTIGARTGTGKSKISLYMLASAAASGATCGMISLDMGKSRLMPYIIPAFNNVFRPAQRVTTGQLYSFQDGGDMRDARIWDVCSQIDPQKRCYVVSDPKTFTMQSIAGYVRILAERGCKVVLLDQVQNIGGWERGAANRGEYHGIYNELKLLPRRYHLTLVVLHQINREGADRPQLKNLQDSGVVEQFSDFVILLHDYQSTLISTHGGYMSDGHLARAPKASEYRLMRTESDPCRPISVHLAKSRSSGAARRDLYFDYSHGVAI